MTTLREAVEYVWRLPYGRIESQGPLAVLDEQRGTCSSKHVLLKRLADELGIRADLMLGIYLMHEVNTPEAIPEAHCWLDIDAVVVDATRWGVRPIAPAGPFLHVETVEPDDLGARKTALHREWMARAIADGWGGGRSLDEAWAVRERCIAALSSQE